MELAASLEMIRRSIINTPCVGRRPLVVAQQQQLEQRGVGPRPRRPRRHSPPGTHREHIRQRLLPWRSRRRSLLPAIERRSYASWLISLGCEGAATAIEKAIEIYIFRSVSAMDWRTSLLLSQEAGQRERRQAVCKKHPTIQWVIALSLSAAARVASQKSPNFRRLSEFSEKLRASNSMPSFRSVVAPLAQVTVTAGKSNGGYR